MKRQNHQLMRTRTELPRGRRERLVFPTTTKITLWVLALALGLAAGCGTARPSKYYQLTVPGNIVPAVDSNPIPVTLLIGRLMGPSIYREDQIVYNSAAESMGTYEYQRCSEPPTDITPEFILPHSPPPAHYRHAYLS